MKHLYIKQKIHQLITHFQYHFKQQYQQQYYLHAYYSKPYINLISPELGPSTLSQTITVTGANFINSDTLCVLNNQEITTTFISSTSLQCIIPAWLQLKYESPPA